MASIGFAKDTSAEQRVAGMDGFMKQHFPIMQFKHIDVPLNRGGQWTVHGFVELGSKQRARFVTSAVKSRSVMVPGFDAVRVELENTEIDRNRN